MKKTILNYIIIFTAIFAAIYFIFNTSKTDKHINSQGIKPKVIDGTSINDENIINQHQDIKIFLTRLKSSADEHEKPALFDEIHALLDQAVKNEIINKYNSY